MRTYLTVVLLTIMNLPARGQSDIDLNHRWLSRLDSNPATINTEYWQATGLTRNQWVGFAGAPISQVFSFSGYSNQINSGFGMTVINDKIGYTKTLNMKALYSYNIQLDDNMFKLRSMESMLSFGLGVGLIHRSIDKSQITTADDTVDETILSNYQKGSIVKPDFNFGVNFIHSFSGTGIWRIGTSITHINYIFEKSSPENWSPEKLSCNYYAYTSFEPRNEYMFQKVTPVFGVSYMHRRNISNFELLGMLVFKKTVGGEQRNMFWIGESLKLRGNELSTFLGVEIFKNLNLGYVFEYTYSSVGQASRTSHEMMLSWTLPISGNSEPNCAAYRGSGGGASSHAHKFLIY